MLAVRSVLRMIFQLGRGSVRTGRWWVPIAVVLLVVAHLIAGAAAVVVPSATYTLF